MADAPSGLRDAEAASAAMAQLATHHGYGFADGSWGRLRVLCIKETGRFSYFLNNVPVNFRRAAQATA